jgi:hypothetical protein
MENLPEEIQQALTNLGTAGNTLGIVTKYKATIDLYLTSVFTKQINQLCQELQATREQMSQSSDVASKQTEALVKTTKWYTVITGGVLVLAALTFFAKW